MFSIALSGVEIRVEANEAGDNPKPGILKLAAWNIEKLGYNVEERKHEELQKMADVLSRYHFIAITELMHKKRPRAVPRERGWENYKVEGGRKGWATCKVEG